MALACHTEALALANRISHGPTVAGVINYAALLHLYRGEPELALACLDEAQALVAEQQISMILGPQILRGAGLLALGEISNAISCLREGLPPGRTGGVRTFGVCLLAQALTQQGECEEALAAISQALRTVDASGEGLWKAELHHALGLVLLTQDQIVESEARLKEALKVARDQQAKSWELRAATSLARLWGEQGRRAEAHELLAPVYGWLTEGFDTADLKEAKRLLEELAA